VQVYFIPIVISIFLLACSKFFYIKSRKEISLLFFIISVLPTSILAGARDLSIGTDISIYGYRVFSIASQSTSFLDLYRYFEKEKIETVYLYINYIISRFTDNINIFLFLLNFFTVILALISFFIMRNKINVIIATWLYYTTIWLYSFNLLRQSLATSMFFIAAALLLNKKYKLYTIVSFLTYSLHRSSIVPILVILVLHLLTRKRNAISAKFVYLVGMLIIFVSSINYLLPFFLNTVPFFSKYSNYIVNVGGFKEMLSLKFLLVSIPVISLFSINTYTHNKLNQPMIVYSSFIAMTLLSTIKTSYIFSERMYIYFVFFIIIYISSFFKNTSLRISDVLFRGLFVSYYFLFPILFFQISNNGQIFPYVFK